MVEGHGEVEALPELLRRLAWAAGMYDMKVQTPVLSSKGKLVAASKLATELPAGLHSELSAVVKDHCRPMAAELVVANPEYEVWFASSLSSLRGLHGLSVEAVDVESAESRPECKGILSSVMSSGMRYQETQHQTSLTAQFDLRLAFQNSRSFQKLVKAFGDLSAECGRPLTDWPPAAWAG